MVLKQIHDTNMRARGEPERVFTVNRIKVPRQLDELVEMPSETANPGGQGLHQDQGGDQRHLADVHEVLQLPGEGQHSEVAVVHRHEFKSVVFVDSTFINCYFEDVSTAPSSDSFFYNTDIDDVKLTNSRMISSSFHHNKTGCQVSFDDDYSAYWVYFVNFLGTLAVLPGNIVSALLMDKIGRLSMLGGSMVLSGISCFFLWFGTSESMMIFMLCLYNGLSISAWNSLDVVTAELYPTDRRWALCAIPILLASAVLVTGGLVGLRLPDTRANVLM
ncbi:hypothetical protein CRUP_007639 [Coryphaenoides rupestris]|nr:hypothetical protein CRUP_007639 [Coryphaenoides rupestris]